MTIDKILVNKDISSRVQELLRKSGIKQKQLCEQTDIKTTTLSGNITNNAFWQIDTVIRIAEHFGVTFFNRYFKGDSDIRNMRLGTLLDVCDLLGVPVGDILSEEKEVTDKRDEYIKRLEAENEGYKKSLKTLKDVVIAMNKDVKIKSPV